MAGRGDPPEGTPEGLPGGGEDEYGSVVFDESFVRAARVQEFSATERMGEHAPAVRSLPEWNAKRAPAQILVLVLLVVIAFGTAIYLGVRHPYQPAPGRQAEQLRVTVVPLSPRGPVPGGTPAELYAQSPAEQFRTGAAGITMPPVRRTEHFSEGQVMTALATVKDYLVKSSLDPDVVLGDAVQPLRTLLHPDQMPQFDRSVTSPAADGRHATTGWLVRFDPAQVALADPEVRVRGTLEVLETGAGTLEITSDHTFVYALRSAATGPPASDEASLFIVRRELHFRFDRDDLAHHRLEVRSSYLQAGPQSCSADASAALRPLLAGQRPDPAGPAGTDPYATGRASAAVCGSLAPEAQPSP
ncbi:SCO2583 family membrane protein [Streptomyces xantholiticus]